MKIIEMIIDENNEDAGVFAISLVNQPAIEKDFIALSKDVEIKFAKADEDKRLLIGPALIPNKTVFRKGTDGSDDYYIYFSQDTVRKTAELFLKNNHQGEATLEHKLKLSGLTVVESWVVEDEEKDKSRVYGMDVPVGTWMITMKVDNQEVYDEAVKTGEVKGFSIEGHFVEKMQVVEQSSQAPELTEEEKAIEAIRQLIQSSGL